MDFPGSLQRLFVQRVFFVVPGSRSRGLGHQNGHTSSNLWKRVSTGKYCMKRGVEPPRHGQKSVQGAQSPSSFLGALLLVECCQMWPKGINNASKMMFKSEPTFEKIWHLGLDLSKGSF